MILEKLMEKKDMLAYLTARQALLTDEKLKAANIKNVSRREVVIRQIQGRLLEISYMKKLMSTDKIKTESKRFWKRAAKKGVLIRGR